MIFRSRKPYGKAYNPNRFNASDSALAFIVVLLAFYFVPLIVIKLFKPFFKAAYDFDYYAYMSINVLFSQSIMFLTAAAISAVKRVNAFDGGGYKAKFDGVMILMAMTLTAGIMLTFYYVHLRFGEDAEALLGSPFESVVNQSAFSPLFALLYLALIAVLPALVEEMMFRGIIMRGLEGFGGFAAVIISSIAFSLMHGNFSQVILQFLGGVAIGSVVYITKNWLLGSAMHFFNNLFSTVFAIVISDSLFTEPLLAYVPFVADAACIVIGLTCLMVGATYFTKLAVKINNGGEVKPGGEQKNYVVTGGDNVEFKPYFETVALEDKKLLSGKTYYIRGKFRKMNFKANPVLSAVLLAVGGVIAIISMFL